MFCDCPGFDDFASSDLWGDLTVRSQINDRLVEVRLDGLLLDLLDGTKRLPWCCFGGRLSLEGRVNRRVPP